MNSLGLFETKSYDNFDEFDSIKKYTSGIAGLYLSNFEFTLPIIPSMPILPIKKKPDYSLPDYNIQDYSIIHYGVPLTKF